MDANTGPVVLINLFEVPPGADEGFIAGWEAARDSSPPRTATAPPPCIAASAQMSSSGSSTWPSGPLRRPSRPPPSQPDFPGRELPFPAHPGLYRVVAEDPPPPEDPGGVVLINAFEVPPEGDDAFLAGWEGTRAFLHAQPGYLATRLHRSLSPETEFRFINVGRYTSHQAFQAAIGQPGFRQSGRGHPARPSSRPLRGHPTLTARQAACHPKGGRA
jgi:heme-degrading monooxygenase HmoA